MIQAMEAVISGEMGTNQAAHEFDVPATTLKDRLSGRVNHNSKPGPAPYLTEEEERELVDFLVQVARLGYGKTKQEVIDIVRKTLEKREPVLQSSVGKGGVLDSRSSIPSCHLGQLIHFPCLVQIRCLKQRLMCTSIFQRRR